MVEEKLLILSETIVKTFRNSCLSREGKETQAIKILTRHDKETQKEAYIKFLHILIKYETGEENINIRAVIKLIVADAEKLLK